MQPDTPFLFLVILPSYSITQHDSGAGWWAKRAEDEGSDQHGSTEGVERETKPRKRGKVDEILWVASSVFQLENDMCITGTGWKVLEESC